MKMALSEKFLSVLNIQESSLESVHIHEMLSSIGLKIFLKRVSTQEELLSSLASQEWDLIISDIQTHKLSAQTALGIIHQKSHYPPFILVSERIGEEMLADMMHAGVEDFVSKSSMDRLVPVVKRILREHETREKEAKALRLANMANAAREQMLAIVSHDIKNPLSAIRLEAQMLLRAAERSGKSLLGEEVKIQAGRILKTTDRVRTLITDLLDKNKTENGLSTLSKSEVVIAQLIQEILDTNRPHLQEKKIELKINLPVGELQLYIDRNKMFQVLSNLLSNAIKFTPEGGTIQLCVNERDHDLIFNVIDSGTGLRSEDLPKVFEKYWTGRFPGQSGTGLGLFICKTIVEAHGGEIHVENIKNQGARFFFNIPKQIQGEVRNLKLGQLKADQRKKILVLDDDADLREVMCWALSKEGFAVESYGDPKAALEMLKQNENCPHLILADYHMHGMKGGEFLRLKKDLGTHMQCPVIMISASPSEVEREVDRELYKEVITKPVDLEGLVENMKRYLVT